METNDFVLRRVPARFRALAVLTGGVFGMLSLGNVYTFGNLLPYLVSYYRWKIDPNMTTGSMIWLQTLMSGLPFAMLIGGIVERTLGGRKASILGCLIYTSGIACTYFAVQSSYAATLLTMGIWASLGSSIAYAAILTTAQRWLPNNVGMAGGIILGGYGCGAFILSPLQTTYINPLDYRPNDQGYFTQEDLLEAVPKVFLVMALLFLVLQTIGLTFITEPDETISVEADSLIAEGPSREDAAESSQIGAQLKSTTFILLFTSLMCNAVWGQLTSGLYKAYGQKFIHSDLFLSFVGSMASVFNASSRVFWGVLVDATSFQFTMCLVCTLGAVLAWLLPAIQYIASDLIFLAAICLMFSCIGGTYSLFPYVTHICFGNTNFSIIYGVMQVSLSVAGLIAGLLSQFGLPLLGYERLFLISGSFMVLSLFLTMVLNFTKLARTVSAARQLNRQAPGEQEEQ